MTFLTQEKILRIIREHPEGIATVDIAEILGVMPGDYSMISVRSKINTRCCMLEKYGYVRKEQHRREGRGRQVFNVWFPEAAS